MAEVTAPALPKTPHQTRRQPGSPRSVSAPQAEHKTRPGLGLPAACGPRRSLAHGDGNAL